MGLQPLGQLGEDQVREPGRQGVHRRARVVQGGWRGLRLGVDPRQLRRGGAAEVQLVRGRHVVGRGHRLQ